MNYYKVAIAGNPNCGKTTLFNALTGSSQKIGNWPGVTVEQISGTTVIEGNKYEFVDLPGTYSLTSHSLDERVSRNYILSHDADLIVNVVDATNLEQNLYFTVQLLEMKCPMVIALNRMDLARKKKINIDIDELSKRLGCPVFPVSAIATDEVTKFRGDLASVINNNNIPTSNVIYPNEIENIISLWQKRLSTYAQSVKKNPSWLSLKLIEKDYEILEELKEIISECEVLEAVECIEKIHKEEIDILIADYRYGFIHGLILQNVKRSYDKKEVTDQLDSVILNPIFGIPIFLVVMYFTFFIAINVSSVFIDFIDTLFGGIFIDGSSSLLKVLGAPDMLINIISNGFGSGIQTVATFIPIIFFMFFMLAVLEDSGYMARAAFVMDRFTRILGLPGKSFVPMLIGFGCTVPAIMGSRILENRRDRMFTIFLTPFISCGAKLPVYALFTSVFFTHHSGLIVFSLYTVGILVALITGVVLRHTFFKGSSSHFIMELPSYNFPRLKHIMIHTWLNLREFFKKAGAIIIIGVSLLSILNTTNLGGSQDSTQNNSVLAHVGKAVTPIFHPIGIDDDNWEASVGLISGVFAKESVIISMTALYSQDNSKVQEDEASFDFRRVLLDSFTIFTDDLRSLFNSFFDIFGLSTISVAEEETSQDGSIAHHLRTNFSKGPLQAYAYLLFVLLYFPCLGAVGTLVKEAGKTLATIIILYTTLTAWIIATLFYQLTLGHSILWISVALGLSASITLTFYIAGKNPALIDKYTKE